MRPLIASIPLNSSENGGTMMSMILLFGYFGSSVIPYVVERIGDMTGITIAILSGAFVFLLLGLTAQYIMPLALSDRNGLDKQ